MKEGDMKDNKGGKRMSSLELLNDASICFTGEQILASQVAVLTTVARFPGISSGMIVAHTGLSPTNVGRVLAYLYKSGDIVFIKQPKKNLVDMSPKAKRKCYVTQDGAYTIAKLMRHMRWSKRGKFGVVAIIQNPTKEIFEL